MPDYELSPDAEEDLCTIADYTIANWGVAQSVRYEAALIACFEAIASGEARPRPPIPYRPDIVACRCEHHYVFALVRPAASLLVLAVLHESMDLMARLRERLDG